MQGSNTQMAPSMHNQVAMLFSVCSHEVASKIEASRNKTDSITQAAALRYSHSNDNKHSSLQLDVQLNTRFSMRHQTHSIVLNGTRHVIYPATQNQEERVYTANAPRCCSSQQCDGQAMTGNVQHTAAQIIALHNNCDAGGFHAFLCA